MNDTHQLISQLKSSGKTPAEQLDHILETLGRIPDAELQQTELQAIVLHLTQLAKSWKIHQPEIFARQLLFMLTDARRKQLAQPENGAIQHVRIAARALIAAQRKNRFSRNSHFYAMAASVFLLFGVGSMMLGNTHAPINSKKLTVSPPTETETRVLLAVNNPMRLSEMISNREKMREGRCHFPEALVFAESERSIYIKNVVHGEITNDFKEQEIARRLMQSVRCDYTPMLMKNSVS